MTNPVLLFASFTQVAQLDPNLKLLCEVPMLKEFEWMQVPQNNLILISQFHKEESQRKKGKGIERSKVKGKKESKYRGVKLKACFLYVEESLPLEIGPILFCFHWSPARLHTTKVTR